MNSALSRILFRSFSSFSLSSSFPISSPSVPSPPPSPSSFVSSFLSKPLTILTVESTCDDTSLAILRTQVSSHYSSPFISSPSPSPYLSCHRYHSPHIIRIGEIHRSQWSLYDKFGGVHPKYASEEHRLYLPSLYESLKENIQSKYSFDINNQIDAIVLALGPGLSPCLGAGLKWSQMMAHQLNIPIIPVNHVHAHVSVAALEADYWMYSGPSSNNNYNKKKNNNSNNNNDNMNNNTNNNMNNDIPTIIKSSSSVSSLSSPSSSSPSSSSLSSFSFSSLSELCYPHFVLLASGGHTELWLSLSPFRVLRLGCTLDDSAGESYDKIARMLKINRLSNESPGASVERLAKEWDNRHPHQSRPLLTIPMLHSRSCDFSFSGLKQAIRQKILDLQESKSNNNNNNSDSNNNNSDNLSNDISIEDQQLLCASFEQTVAGHLIRQTNRAISLVKNHQNQLKQEISNAYKGWINEIKSLGGGDIEHTMDDEKLLLESIDFNRIQHIVVSGGVAANHYLRSQLSALASHHNLLLVCPPRSLCTDNSVMIGVQGLIRANALGMDRVSYRGDNINSMRFHPNWPVGPLINQTFIADRISNTDSYKMPPSSLFAQ